MGVLLILVSTGIVVGCFFKCMALQNDYNTLERIYTQNHNDAEKYCNAFYDLKNKVIGFSLELMEKHTTKEEYEIGQKLHSCVANFID